jgi:hypothetical protein
MIHYEIAHSANVRLTVYNLLEQEIAVLVNGYQTAGIYKADFNASDLTGGVYFYRFQADHYVQQRKMIILK